MSFPTHDILQAQMLFYRLMGIADDINDAIAETGMKAEVLHTPDLLQYVKVPLEGGGGVSLAMNSRFPGAWMIAWPVGHSTAHSVWPLEIERELLVKIVAMTVHDGIHGRELPSPFCWGRTERSGIVDLADQLVAIGVDRSSIGLEPLRVMDEDEMRPRYPSGNRSELRLVDRSDRERTLVVRLDSKVGWSVDQVMPAPAASGRMDLAAPLGLTSQLPCVGIEDVEVGSLAQLLAEDTFWLDVPDDDQRHLFLYGQAPEHRDVYSKDTAERAATAWLTWAGFADPSDRWARTPRLTPAIELQIDYSTRQLSIGRVQRYKGVAAVSGRTPVVVARSGFSKNACEWGDAAEMLLFTIDDDGLLHPANGLANAHTPSKMGPRPGRCDDSACRAIGCVLDDEFCPMESGKRSHPDAERWRLL